MAAAVQGPQARHVDPTQHAREIRRSPADLRTADSAALTPDTPKSGKGSVSKTSSWGWAQKTWSFLAPEADETSPTPGGFEAFNVVKKAADGIASTATAMATSLDSTVEQLFEGWTPAPPASDHTPPSRPHIHSRSKAAKQSEAAQNTDKSHAQVAHASQTDGWSDWGSSFGSRSPSPDLLASQEAGSQQQSSIAAWCVADSGAEQMSQQQRQQQPSPAAPHSMNPAESASQRQQASSVGKENACPTGEEPVAGFAVKPVMGDSRRDPTASSWTPPRSQAGASPTSVAIRGLSSSPVLQPVQCQQPPKSEATSPERDPLADQMAGQLQALLAEKARLAQENDRLARENNGLQELLQYTMHQHLPESADSLDDWATVENALPERGPLPGVENGSPLVSPR